jgi:hypothetical protein
MRDEGGRSEREARRGGSVEKEGDGEVDGRRKGQSIRIKERKEKREEKRKEEKEKKEKGKSGIYP